MVIHTQFADHLMPYHIPLDHKERNMTLTSIIKTLSDKLKLLVREMQDAELSIYSDSASRSLSANIFNLSSADKAPRLRVRAPFDCSSLDGKKSKKHRFVDSIEELRNPDNFFIFSLDTEEFLRVLLSSAARMNKEAETLFDDRRKAMKLRSCRSSSTALDFRRRWGEVMEMASISTTPEQVKIREMEAQIRCLQRDKKALERIAEIIMSHAAISNLSAPKISSP